MYQVQKQKGITLIALVITIIVLIILAGVAINLSIGENGILTRAQNAKKQSENDTVKENIETAVLQVQIEEVTETGKLTLLKIYENLSTKDSNISLESYNDGDTFLSGTYSLNGKEYSFTIDEEFNIVVGKEAEVKPVQTEEMVWNDDGTITLTLSSKISDSIEYQVNSAEDGNWTVGTTVTGLQEGDIVYVRVNDGTTVTEVQEIEIKDTIAPEEFEITTSDVTYESLKISGSTVDNQTGLATYSYIAATTSSEIVQKIENQTVTEYAIEGLEAETEYVVYMLAYDNAGNVRKSNEVTVTTEAMPVAQMFGQYVDYPIDIDDNEDDYDWQVFYIEDDETSPNYGATYLIADYYVPVSKMTTSITNAGMKNYSGTYQVYWSSAPTYKTITDEVKSIFMYDYTGSDDDVKYVSRLLDTTAWESDFVTTELQEKGGMAIGGPTINMWCAGWNKTYPTQKLIATISESGYLVNESKSMSLSSYTGWISAPNVFFPLKGNSSGSWSVSGYYISSPSPYHNFAFNVRCYNGTLVGNDIWHLGVRVLVYLPTSVTLEKDSITENLWHINYGESEE